MPCSFCKMMDEGRGLGYLSERLCYIPEKGRGSVAVQRVVEKNTDACQRDGEPSCLALEPEVSDLILYPDRDRDIGKHQKVEELIMWCVSRLVRDKGQTKVLKILLFLSSPIKYCT